LGCPPGGSSGGGGRKPVSGQPFERTIRERLRWLREHLEEAREVARQNMPADWHRAIRPAGGQAAL